MFFYKLVACLAGPVSYYYDFDVGYDGATSDWDVYTGYINSGSSDLAHVRTCFYDIFFF